MKIKDYFVSFPETVHLFQIICCVRLYRIAFSRVRFLYPSSPDIGGGIRNQENLAKTTETIANNDTKSQIKEHKKYEVDCKRSFSCVVKTPLEKKTKTDKQSFHTPTYISVTYVQIYSPPNGQLFRSISF